MMASPLPPNFTLQWNPSTSSYREGTVLIGGSPLRMMRLAPTGAAVVTRWRDGDAVGVHGTLARRLTAAGIFEPLAPHGHSASVTVVIPVYNNPTGLEASLHGITHPVIVVDDGSINDQATAISDVCARHNVKLVRCAKNCGPAAARNVGWRHAASDLVLFLDSDANCPPLTIRRLVDHFADHDVVAVAPRIASSAAASDVSRIARYETAHSPLDLGAQSASVKPLSRVAYVPSTCLMVRRKALEAVGGFDEQLRFGEDVDLVWRLSETGIIRYDAAVVAHHDHPTTFGAMIKRRVGYGSSAAALDRKHPTLVAPSNCSPYTAGAWLAVAAGHPAVGLATMVGSAAMLPKKLKDLPPQAAWKLAITGHLKAWKMFTSATRRAWLPMAVAAAIPNRNARRWLALSLLSAGPLTVASDAAYCVGVYKGCWRERSWRAILPKLSSWPPRPTTLSPATK